MKCNDVHTYTIQIHGQVEEEDIHPSSPVRFTVEPGEGANTWIMLQADQAGMIGLIRHMHGIGLVLISLSCSLENLPDDQKPRREKP